MIALTAAEVAGLTGGRLASTDGLDATDAAHPTDAADQPTVTGTVVIDSRQAVRGSLFVAVRGEGVDGHDYGAAAAAGGAVLALGERMVAGLPTVLVDDSVVALSRLAAGVRDRLVDVRVVGLTGSAGKTGSKDLIAALLEQLGPTVAPPGNFNNELGLPLTLLRADAGTRFLVLEMGARGMGQITALAQVARPDVGVVLNVGSAHLGEFGSREMIAEAKGELVEALPATGIAVLNADDPLVAAMRSRTRARVVTFGQSPGADVRAVRVETVDGRSGFVLTSTAGSAPVQLGLLGEHQVSNALAAAAVALDLGLPLDVVATTLSAARPRSRWRMEVHERPDGVTVINDAYNASPESMRAALKTLVEVGRGRRTWAVLGEMRELGADTVAEHDAIGRLVVRLDVNRLVVVGSGARTMFLGAGLEGSWGNEAMFVDDVAGAVTVLQHELAPGDVVLVKASRAAGLERVAEAILSSPDDRVGDAGVAR